MNSGTAGLVSVVIPCYRDSARAVALVRALGRQRLPAGWSQEIIVVDDGSGPPHAEVLAGLSGDSTAIVTLTRNAGRSAAIAQGVDRARGELLMVIDSDCLPGDDGLLAAHIDALSDARVGASAGSVRGHDDRFWSRYQDDVVVRRAGRRNALPGTTGSTANCCMRRQAYLTAGGLDLRYKGYGFEDRDLLLRLAATGVIAWTPAAVVRHMDELTLANVCRKIAEAGQGNASLFARQHPAAYRSLGYARFDARGRRFLLLAGRLLDPLVPRMAALVEPLLERLPFPAGRFLVRALSALAFLAGTSRAQPLMRRIMS